jgi:cytoskeletal protein CcmA (bactofilin family)
MSNVNKGSVMMALPIAKSIAIKDACDHFGDLFGANLNRKDIVQFTGDTELLSAESVHNSKEKERVIKHIENATTMQSLEQVQSLAIKYELEIIYDKKQENILYGFKNII